MWQQIVHIASGGTGIGVSLDNVVGEQELDQPTANSIEEENLQYIIDDLKAENKELRKSRNSLYLEIENLKSRLENKEELPLFEEFQKLMVELTDAKRLISFLETHNREQAESAGLLQIQLQKTEANLEDLKNEIVKIHPYKVQYLEYKNQNDAREVEMVGIKRELRELMDKIVVLESAREAFFVERRNNTSLIQKLKLELEIFQSENSDMRNKLEQSGKRIAELESEAEGRKLDILESDVVKELILAKEKIDAENMHLKKKYKHREFKKTNLARKSDANCLPAIYIGRSSRSKFNTSNPGKDDLLIGLTSAHEICVDADGFRGVVGDDGNKIKDLKDKDKDKDKGCERSSITAQYIGDPVLRNYGAPTRRWQSADSNAISDIVYSCLPNF